jgi:hypothetical protein
MASVSDPLDSGQSKITAPRHPEKAHRSDQPVARKPEWIRVKAPDSGSHSPESTCVSALMAKQHVSKYRNRARLIGLDADSKRAVSWDVGDRDSEAAGCQSLHRFDTFRFIVAMR